MGVCMPCKAKVIEVCIRNRDKSRVRFDGSQPTQNDTRCSFAIYDWYRARNKWHFYSSALPRLEESKSYQVVSSKSKQMEGPHSVLPLCGTSQCFSDTTTSRPLYRQWTVAVQDKWCVFEGKAKREGRGAHNFERALTPRAGRGA